MARQARRPKSSLRNNIMVAFFLTIILVGVSITAMSQHILRHTLAETGLPADVIEHIGRHFIQMLTAITMAGIVLALLVAGLLARAMTRTIGKLLKGVTEISSGALDTRIDLPQDDEFGRLAQAFNAMTERLSQSYDNLEEKVEQRTAELSAINATLEREVNERRKTEDDLRESLSLLEATLESTADGILVTDREGRIKDYNNRFKELWGIPDAVLKSRNDDEALSFVLYQLKEPEAFLAKVKELYGKPHAESFDALEFKDGRQIERYSKPQIIGDEVVGRVWSFRDVTQRRQAEQRQASLLRRVAEINEELTHFAYVVSHDLKAPLRGVNLIADWLCDDYQDKLGVEARQQLDLLRNRVARMHNLIDGVLQYSRVGRIKEDIVEVNLNELIDDIVDAIAPPEHAEITVAGALPTIACEKTRITQVFQNLLTNAVKHMDKPRGKVTITCAEEGDFWKFSVADNGCGIEEKHFDRIFRIFQTLAPRDEAESTGVGLTLVKKIVEMYGGRVWVESEINRGSTFFFTLAKDKMRARAEPLPVAAAR